MAQLRCDEIADLIEPWAAGELSAPDAVKAHVESCPRCQSALSLARRIEQILASPDVDVPARFSQNVLNRRRRDWWRAEQRIDWWFNAGIGAAVVVIVLAVVIAVQRTRLVGVLGDVFALITAGVGAAAGRPPEGLPLYAVATVFVLSVLFAWRWIDGDLI